MTRRRFLGASARSLGALPFVLDPIGKSLIGQTVPPAGRPVRFITIFTPQVPFTYKENGSWPSDIWFRQFWDTVTDSAVRSSTRFFPNFSYNVFPLTQHDLGYSVALTGCQFPNIEDYDHARMAGRTNPSSVVDYPINSLDHRIAQAVNSGFSPVFDMTNQLALLLSEMVSNVTSEGYWYTTNIERNFLDFVSFDAQGRVRVPWNDPGQLLPILFNATPTNPGSPTPPPTPTPPPPTGASVAVERILERIHGTEVARYVSSRGLQQTETSYRNLDYFRARLEELRNRRAAQDVPGGGSGGNGSPAATCVPPTFNAPNQLPVGREGQGITTAQMDTALDFHFEALLHNIRCDMTRVSNFMFTNWEDAIGGASYPGTSGGINVHNEGSHYEGSFGNPNDSNRRNIGFAYRYWYGKVGNFLSRMAAEADPVVNDGSSLLDNSVVYIASQHGSHVEWGTHQMNNTAVAVVGGGRSLGNGQTVLPALTSSDVLGHVFDGENKYAPIRGQTVSLSRPRREIRNYNYDGGDLVTNLQLALLRLFDPSATSHGSDDLARSRLAIDLSSPAAYAANR